MRASRAAEVEQNSTSAARDALNGRHPIQSEWADTLEAVFEAGDAVVWTGRYAKGLTSDPACPGHLTYLHLNLQNFKSWDLMKVKTQCEQLASL